MSSRKGDHLTVVDANTPAPRKVPETITEALGSSSRDVLAAMRLQLARKLDAGEVSSNAIASSYKELRELDRLIRAADAEQQNASGGGNDGGQRTRRTFDASAI